MAVGTRRDGGGSEPGPQTQPGFAALFRAHADFACRVLRRFGVADADLADACQDVFLIVHRKLPSFEGRSALRTWLYRIAAGVASDYRKRAHRRHETAPLVREPSVGAEQQRRAEHAQLRALIVEALDGLDDDKRRVFVLYELEELPMGEVAALLGCPLKTAFSRLYVARRRLRSVLGRAGYAGLWLPLLPGRLQDLLGGPTAAALKATGSAPGAPSWVPGLSTATATGAGIAAGAGSPLLASLAPASTLVVVAALTLAGATQQAAPRPGAVLQHEAPLALASTTAKRRIPFEHVPAERNSLEQEPAATETTQTRDTRDHRRRAHPRPAPAQPAAAPAAAAAPAPVTDWMEAQPTPRAQRDAEEPAPTRNVVGLDEVLSATSIRPLLRVRPQDTDAPWVLVP